ncbi:UDP-2,3-diacylglucosamine hydrolase [Phenylobacterium sp. Root77]|uniref:UDP-2,3-diacylglucosamine diphosphatase n=1 Tax=unclassified Phenylobacterium TaxID=2640670 RepID=UPI0006F277FC|nr:MULTISPECIES: UDP-2,3-diacylglucosamine diphosphatase [unclassified Phenylobacterium]KQW70954.1 UDP-2,3-diacylglucosamine hydrolase [Phenylobacterium sp. Root1277]KQW95888.1 UDP-2,3-diacylglucosamine hydrolase [Phenylobacterium sp. Root1290]KRC41673.1 UDP-2,3-diacylglucosamine hydrolase [Phenylobacterium sp. Root77]
MADLPIRNYRAVFISDIHLGTKGCQAELLLDFIRHIECETLYLVGDIVDGWKLRSGWHWPQSHNDVVQKILRLARKGVNVIYVPGNHDDRVREFVGVHFGGVVVVRDAIHETADGKRFLVLHGDEFDGVVQHARWLAFVGDYAYRALIATNTLFNRIRRRMGFGYWSLSAFLKTRVKNALQFVENFEAAVADEARRRGVDGVICGHIHKAEMRDIDGIAYINDGDWVESCSALVEHHDGTLEILHWAKLRSWSAIDRTIRLVEPALEPEALPTPAAA